MLLALLEDELVVILVHLGNVVSQKVLVTGSGNKLVWHRLLLKLLRSLHRVKYWSIDRHSLLQVRCRQLGQPRILDKEGLHSKCVCVSLSKETSLPRLVVLSVRGFSQRLVDA